MTDIERYITRLHFTTPGMTPLIIARLLGIRVEEVEEVEEYIKEIEEIGE